MLVEQTAQQHTPSHIASSRDDRIATSRVFAAGNAVPGAATPRSGLTAVLLGRGTDQSDGNLVIQEGTDVVVTQITVVAGGSSGWRCHPGGAMIVIKSIIRRHDLMG